MPQNQDSLKHLVSVISGGTYSLSLDTIDPAQVLYNGKITYLTNYHRPQEGGWCHLLLLRSRNEFSKQLLAILTQTPDCSVSIVNTIEHIASFIINLFGGSFPSLFSSDEVEGRIIDIEMTPSNIIFVEYLPAGCFGKGHDKDTFAVMRFLWHKKEPLGGTSYYQASPPGFDPTMWRDATLDDINKLIAQL